MKLIQGVIRKIAVVAVAVAAMAAVVPAASAASSAGAHPDPGNAAFCYDDSREPYQIVAGGTVYGTGIETSCPVPPTVGCKLVVDLFKSSAGVSGFAPVDQSNPGWTAACTDGSAVATTATYKCLAHTVNSEFYTETWLTINDGGAIAAYPPVDSETVSLPCN
jgi:hypothetical protein